MSDEIICRIAKKDSYCRGCDKINIKDKDIVVVTYSSRNKGMNIILCPECVGDMFRKLYRTQKMLNLSRKIKEHYEY